MHRPDGSAGAGPARAAREPAARPVPSTRRQLLRGAGAVAAVGAIGTGAVAARRALPDAVDPRTVIPLWSGTVARDAEGGRVLVGGRAPDLPLDPGTRLAAALPAGAPARERAAAFAARTAPWRERLGRAPAAQAHEQGHGADGSADGEDGAGEALRDLADSALADLWVLSDDLPAPVAGWTRPWRYVWPRDAAFCAVALGRLGAVEQATSVLAHLGTLQAADGWFEARYVPGTDRAPDRRLRQFDGTGLLLWACAETVDAAGGGDVAGADVVDDRLAPLITASLGALVRATSGGTTLPPVSPDYWEVTESEVTLWLMASTLAGLRAGARLTGDAAVGTAAEAFAALLAGTFGRGGWQRYRAGGGADSALALLDATGCHGMVPPARLLGLHSELARPAGGIAPGAAWRQDGVSWTPSTSLLALALARAGHCERAAALLGWLAAHRTVEGSLPEKVLFDGRPAEVAPLAWTAANVLLALDALTG